MKAIVNIGPESKYKLAIFMEQAHIRHPDEDVCMTLSSGGVRLECGELDEKLHIEGSMKMGAA